MSNLHRSGRLFGLPLVALLAALPVVGGIHCSGSGGDDDSPGAGDDDVSQAGDDDASAGDDDASPAGDDDASASGDDDTSASGDDDASASGDDDASVPSGCTAEMLSCDYVQKHVFAVSCATYGCHTGPKPAGNMNLNASPCGSSIIGVAPDNAAAKKDGLVRVSPGDLSKSFLWAKVSTPTGQLPPTYGQIMPPELAQLPLDEQTIIRCWIEGGAHTP